MTLYVLRAHAYARVLHNGVKQKLTELKLQIYLDVVAVYADDSPCSRWRIEWIEQVIIGADAQKRAATQSE